MKRKFDGGYSLVEIVVAIAVLGMLVAPTCTCLVSAVKMNAAAEQMRQAQLAVSSAVETLLASGITEDFFDALDEDPQSEEYKKHMGAFSGVTVRAEPLTEQAPSGNEIFTGCYRVSVTSELLDSVYAETIIRHTEPKPTEPEQEGGG